MPSSPSSPARHRSGSGRVQDDELRAIGNQPGEFADVEPEIHLLAQLDQHRFRAEEVDH